MPTLDTERDYKNIFTSILNWLKNLKTNDVVTFASRNNLYEIEKIVIQLENVLPELKSEVEIILSNLFDSVKSIRELKYEIIYPDRYESENLRLFQRFERTITDILFILKIAENPDKIHLALERIKEFKNNIFPHYQRIPKAGFTFAFNNQFYRREEEVKLSWIYNSKYQQYLYQWIINIKFSGNSYPASKINKFLWSFTEFLESISGVHVEIESAGTGSIWLRLRAFIGSETAKTELKMLLEKGRSAVEAEYLDKPVVNNEKTQAEARKANAEADSIERQKETLPDNEEALKIRAFNIQKKELEIRKQELENRKLEAEIKKLELENIEKSVDITERLAYMIKEGMLSANSVTIDINGLPYLSSSNGKIIQGATIEDIEAKGLIKPGDESIE